MSRDAFFQLRTQRQLGGILDDLGHYEGAVKCYRGSLEVQVRALGSNHIDVASTKDSLGVTLWRLGKYQDALVLYDEALQVRARERRESEREVCVCVNEGERVCEFFSLWVGVVVWRLWYGVVRER